MKNFGSFLLCKWTVSVYSVKQLPIFAVLHENVYFRTCFDHLIHLSYILVEDVSLDIYLQL